MSIPLAFGTTLQTIPAKVPYLKSERPRLAAQRSGLHIGLAWAGNPGHYEDHRRSIRLEQLAPLWKIEGVEFHSLQKDDAAKQAKDLAVEFPLVDLTDELQDFSDTADLVASLDLVISVDTAVVHLAGALAETGMGSAAVRAEWRWLLQREDSPWYPTMRLFRQKTHDDWASVIQRVANSLGEFNRGTSTRSVRRFMSTTRPPTGTESALSCHLSRDTAHLLSYHFDEHAFGSPAIEFAVKDLLPWAEIQVATRDCDNDLTAHDLALHVGVGIVLSRPIVPIS